MTHEQGLASLASIGVIPVKIHLYKLLEYEVKKLSQNNHQHHLNLRIGMFWSLSRARRRTEIIFPVCMSYILSALCRCGRVPADMCLGWGG